MKQEALFNLYKYLSEELKDFGGYIQNDFDIMLQDKTITKEEIQKASEEYRKDFLEFIVLLKELYKDTDNLFEKYKEN